MRTLFLLLALCAFSVHAAKVAEVKFKVLDGFGGDAGSVANRCQTRTGADYDPVTVRHDVTNLRDSKEFARIDADAQETEKGVVVTFYVNRKMRYHAPLIVKGAKGLSESTIVSESGLKDGYLYDAADLAKAAANVQVAYQKKHYPDARVTPTVEMLPGGNNCHVTLTVVEGERQKIRKYVFAGMKGLEESQLQSETVDTPWWNPVGWFVAKERMGVNREYEDEMPEAIEESEVHGAINDLPWWNPLGWFLDQPVTAEQLALCRDRIAEVYRNRGFLDVVVTGPVRVPVEPGKVDVRYTVEEGPQYTIGSMSIKGLTRYPEGVVRQRSKFPAVGTVAGLKTLNDLAQRISTVVGSGDSGLADTQVDVQYLPSVTDPTRLDVVFKVTEGIPVRIDNVIIEGNEFTKDEVIRREIELEPGDGMLADRAERSKRKLENMDYFSRVDYKLRPSGRGKDPSGAEYRDLVYKVDEKNTGSFMFGVGAGSVDSVFVSAEMQQVNFDLFAPRKLFRGAGQKARLYVQAGPRIQTYEASISEPALFGRRLEFEVEGHRRQRWYDEYDIVRTGAGASLAYPVKFYNPFAKNAGDRWFSFGSFGAKLSGEFISFEDVERGTWLYRGREVSLRDEDRRYGDAFEPVLHFFWNRDQRDNFRIPTKGYRTNLFVDLSPAGDNKYWRFGFNHRNYFSVWEKYHHVLMLGLRYETIDGLSDDVPIYNRMFLGGPRTIRGIEYRNVSPMARKLDSMGDPRNSYSPWGGQSLFCASLEYTIPIVKMLRLAAFTDLGSVGVDEFDFEFSDTFAWTAGFGVRLDLPGFPIRLDFAVPIKKPDHADKEVFSFLVGYDF